MVFWKKGVRFSEISPLTYEIAVRKEQLKRHLKNACRKEGFAHQTSDDLLEHIVSESLSDLIKRGPGIDPELQYNKVTNIALAASHMNRILIHPGEEFSFWQLVGVVSEKKGYKAGRVIVGNEVEAGIGGGLCNLANTLNLLILHSPMEITELHTHSDALAPDFHHRVPFANGTSVAYNYVDYRFRNRTEQTVQLVLEVVDEHLKAELRSEKAYPWMYELVEEDHHFKEVDGKFYRFSKIYQRKLDRDTKEELERHLIWDNKSRVMFDSNLIPQELIRK